YPLYALKLSGSFYPHHTESLSICSRFLSLLVLIGSYFRNDLQTCIILSNFLLFARILTTIVLPMARSKLVANAGLSVAIL
ncbi:hypothetical protein, partial [Klebsiella pneumoniae]|uniref:hypothetical protein n=1 Tax=Klebsiella pneumoniae TaxID=573 RepID=UPI001C8F31BA